MFCCLKKKKNIPIVEEKQEEIKIRQTPDRYKIAQLVYTPAPPIKQLPISFLDPLEKQEPDHQLKPMQKNKKYKIKEDEKKEQKNRIYFQSYPLYPPFAIRQQMRKQNQYKPTQKSYFNLIKKINFNTRNESYGHHNQDQEQMFWKTPMIRTFSYQQKVVDVSDKYIEYFHQEFEQQYIREKQRLKLKQVEHLKYLQHTKLQQSEIVKEKLA